MFFIKFYKIVSILLLHNIKIGLKVTRLFTITSAFRKGKHDDYLTFSTGYEFTEYDPNCTEVKDIYKFLGMIIPRLFYLE